MSGDCKSAIECLNSVCEDLSQAEPELLLFLLQLRKLQPRLLPQEHFLKVAYSYLKIDPLADLITVFSPVAQGIMENIG